MNTRSHPHATALKMPEPVAPGGHAGRSRLSALVLVVTLLLARVAIAQTSPSSGGAMSEYEKQTLTAIKDMTSNLLLLATGVFALVGGYLSAASGPIILRAPGRRRMLIGAFFAYGVSLVAGLIVFMGVINQLVTNAPFNANDVLVRLGSGCQIVSVGVGSVAFFLFLISSINAHGEKSEAHVCKPPAEQGPASVKNADPQPQVEKAKSQPS